MSSLWKKAKRESERNINRISRLVSDLREKRESLGVQTGFPTSVADLVVNSNINLFPRQNKRKRSKKTVKKSPERVDSPSYPYLNANPVVSSAADCPKSESVSCRCAGEFFPLSTEAVDRRESESDLLRRAGEVCPLIREQIADAAPLKEVWLSISSETFRTVVKLLLLVILALATKKLALGITVSALCLFFLECSGKRFLVFLKPCDNAREALKYAFVRVSLVFWSEKGVVGFKQDQILQSYVDHVDPSLPVVKTLNQNQGLHGGDLKTPIEEIQIPGSDLDSSDCERYSLAGQTQNREIRVKDQNPEIENKVTQKAGSRKNRIKAKFLKKFIPKKFQNAKHGKIDGVCRTDSSGEISETGSIGSEAQQGGAGICCRAPLSDCKEVEGREKVQIYANVSRIDLVDKNEIGQNVCSKTKGGSEHLAFFVIVLCGLIGGRLMALLFLLLWFLVVKLVKTARGSLTASSFKILLAG